ADDRGAAGHVELHRLHSLAGLEREPAGIEGDALADEGDFFFGIRRRAVADHDEARLLGAAAVDREQTVEIHRLDFFLAPDLHAETAAAAETLRGLAEKARGRHRRRLVDEVARGEDARNGVARELDRALEAAVAGAGADQRHGADFGARLAVGAVFVELIG